ncbi:hypothetical protein [Acanthopleuribacter pedis]|uniref:Uncharacterized protein n=1 Tax=Acanthopleuribacter pedis TaxID=442870 RepID=A0A8J7Q9R7_9BACT|nr:hypothetical protein [Acanthopleuribacter pedis]MBO1321301.1 hypothetical protein [Acanthopleuribacter pedis]
MLVPNLDQNPDVDLNMAREIATYLANDRGMAAHSDRINTTLSRELETEGIPTFSTITFEFDTNLRLANPMQPEKESATGSRYHRPNRFP